MHLFFRTLRSGALIAAAAALTAALPAGAQTVADKVAATAGNAMVSKIGGENCTQFAATMSKMKGSGSQKGSSSMSSRLKSNPEARKTFVNIVAGPLLNKMIDCDMMPGGM
ncbi:MAG TPA: hypothetical protein VJP76_03355 [Candidatus Tumulicola sp.]|nr:hypothetical protein [Candidatus Tumulicola sp.]